MGSPRSGSRYGPYTPSHPGEGPTDLLDTQPPPPDQDGSVSPQTLQREVGESGPVGIPLDTLSLGSSKEDRSGGLSPRASPLQKKLRPISSGRLASLQRTTEVPWFPPPPPFRVPVPQSGRGLGSTPPGFTFPPSQPRYWFWAHPPFPWPSGQYNALEGSRDDPPQFGGSGWVGFGWSGPCPSSFQTPLGQMQQHLFTTPSGSRQVWPDARLDVGRQPSKESPPGSHQDRDLGSDPLRAGFHTQAPDTGSRTPS